MISRAQFLRGDFRGDRSPIRPPWSVNEHNFIELCNRCGDCITSCPQGILEYGRGRYPQVNFRKGECTFCEDCVQACTTDALRNTKSAADIPWRLTVAIEDHCLVQRGVICRSCAEQCEVAAINMRLQVGGVAIPELHSERCTGCGACVRICPVNAVSIRPQGA